jgi:hypothetical protein
MSCGFWGWLYPESGGVNNEVGETMQIHLLVALKTKKRCHSLIINRKYLPVFCHFSASYFVKKG